MRQRQCVRAQDPDGHVRFVRQHGAYLDEECVSDGGVFRGIWRLFRCSRSVFLGFRSELDVGQFGAAECLASG